MSANSQRTTANGAVAQSSKAVSAAARPSEDSSSAAAAPAPVVLGEDSRGKTCTVEQMWQRELKGDVNDRRQGWYGKAIEYWAAVPPTMDGVLGGLSEIHECDVRESAEFINAVKSIGRGRALDCGAGIGRLVTTLLIPLGFAKVDVMEPLPHMIEQARKDIDPARAGDFFQVPMQEAELAADTYDLITVQWAAMYLTDDDFVRFLQKCTRALKPGGAVFFKENCTDGFIVDKEDSSLTRSDAHYKLLFQKSGMVLVRDQYQQNWPKKLYPVKMYAAQRAAAIASSPCA